MTLTVWRTAGDTTLLSCGPRDSAGCVWQASPWPADRHHRPITLYAKYRHGGHPVSRADDQEPRTPSQPASASDWRFCAIAKLTKLCGREENRRPSSWRMSSRELKPSASASRPLSLRPRPHTSDGQRCRSALARGELRMLLDPYHLEEVIQYHWTVDDSGLLRVQTFRAI